MLKYIGNGDFVAGIPARDLTDEEVAQLAPEQVDDLVMRGLYQKPADRKAAKNKPAEDGQQEA
jgi:hypothetical protein